MDHYLKWTISCTLKKRVPIKIILMKTEKKDDEKNTQSILNMLISNDDHSKNALTATVGRDTCSANTSQTMESVEKTLSV
jgi:hypothetical protein